MRKRNLILILAVMLLLVVVAVLYCRNVHSEKWELVWSEEFDRMDGKLDETKWSRIPRGGSDWNNYMSLREDLVEVKDGHLVLWGKVNDRTEEDTARYVTGGVWTKDKFAFQYGKIEIRAKLESATGAWPAFWMLGVNGKYPDNGEIDLMEHLNYDSIVYQTLHTHYTLNLDGRGKPENGSVTKIDPDGYNTYGMEWYPDRVVFLVNGEPTLTYPNLEGQTNADGVVMEGQYPYDKGPFYLLLDMQLGGSWVGGVDPEELPVKMEIDWVKVWRER